MRTAAAVLLALAVSCACVAQDAANLFVNPGFEEIGDNGRPVSWEPVNFGTGGAFGVGTEGAHSGQRYVFLSGTAEENRSCWRQHVLWPADARGVTVTGWYRTRGVAESRGKGASIRFLFNDDPKVWRHLRIETSWYPPSENWARVTTIFPVPQGTRDLVVELFQWYTSGETHWDDVAIRPATDNEMRAVALTGEAAVDREPVLGRNLPYSPADGERVSLNPPPFRWLPSGTGALYRLQVSRDADFSAPLVSQKDMQWCCEMLSEPLEPGTWFWRYGVDLEGWPTIWSQARQFELGAEAAPWPYPKPEAFQVSVPRPHLFITADQLPELRRRAAEGDLKSMAQGLVQSIRRRAGEELHPEPEMLPQDPAQRSIRYTELIRSTRPPMDLMEQAGFAYLLTGDEACGAEAKRRILHFFSWDPAGSTSVFHNDEPAMWIMMRGVRAYDWTYDLFTPEERALVEKSMRARAADFYTAMRRKPYENNPFESHAGRIIGFLGEAALEFHNDWPEAREWLQYITRIYWGVYPAWGKDDGGWNEGPGYWSAYMSFALHFVVALKQATGIDLAQRPFFRNTPHYLLYLTPPYSQMAPFGDGTQWKPSRPGSLMYWFSSLTGDPSIRWYADYLGQGGGTSIVGVVLRDDSIESRPPVDLPDARLFEGVGLVSMHSALGDADNDVHLALRSSPYGAVSHGHNDQNCFVLEAFGEPLAIASGYYNYYGSPHHDKWTRQTKAKCGITFDGGQGQDRGWHAQGQVSRFVHGESFDFVHADATKAYGGRLSKAVRRVVHVRPGVFVILDDLASEEPRKFEYWLHAVDKMDVDAAGRSVTINRPKASLSVRFLEPRALDLAQTDQFDPSPMWPPDTKYENNWHVTASLTESASEGRFLSVLVPSKAGEEGASPTVSRLEAEKCLGAALAFPTGGSTVVVFRQDTGTEQMNIGGVTTDAQTAAISRGPSGELTGLLLGEGTWIGDGKPLVTASGTCTCAISYAADGGRIDAVGPVGDLWVAWPEQPQAITLNGDPVDWRYDGGGVRVQVGHGPQSFQVWAARPVPSGDFQAQVAFGDHELPAQGVRTGRGETVITVRADVPRGLYELTGLPGARLSGALTEGSGRVWLRGGESVSISGSGLPESIAFRQISLATRLQARRCEDIPDGVTFECERDWSESGGSIQVSGGGHANVSGGDNLWAWNVFGHSISWELDVPRAGEYELWMVGATETGFLAEVEAGECGPLAVWFEPTGGWGRTVADEWRAFRLESAPGIPVRLRLNAGPQKVRITNRMGMGLNLDCLVLSRAG